MNSQTDALIKVRSEGFSDPRGVFNFRCVLVDDVDTAQAFLTWLGERRPVLAIDTETTGLKPWGADRLRLVQVGDGMAGWAIPYEDWRGLIRQVLRDYDGPTVGHNWPFDRAFLDAAGLPLPPVHNMNDTMVLSHLLDPARSHALKPSADRLWPGASAAQGALDEGMRTNKWNWATVPVDFLPYWSYACSDTVFTARLHERYLADVQARGLMDAYLREMAVQDIAYRMSKRGLLIDTEYTSNLEAEWAVRQEEVQEELRVLQVDNPASSRQVAQAMQLTEKWDPSEFTETGEPKLDATVLAGIDSSISSRVLEFRRLNKFRRAYLQNFLTGQDANGRVHPDLKPLRARTGRWSITQPALQTLPRGPEIRNCVIPDEGHALWGIDQSNVEMRLLAHYSEDPLLLDAVRKGENLHVVAGREVYQDPTFSKDDERYTLAKNTGFCTCYGGGPKKIAQTAGVPVPEATAFHQMYMSTFSGIARFLDKIDYVGKARLRDTGRGFIKTWGGRWLPCDEDRIYALGNYTIQGSAADIFKVMLIEIDANGFGDNMLLPVHDEVIFQFPKGDTESVRECAAIMSWEEGRGGLLVPLGVGVSGPADRWGSLEK